jgi:hypothetical protein
MIAWAFIIGGLSLMLQANFDLSVKESREVFSKWCESLEGN